MPGRLVQEGRGDDAPPLPRQDGGRVLRGRGEWGMAGCVQIGDPTTPPYLPTLTAPTAGMIAEGSLRQLYKTALGNHVRGINRSATLMGLAATHHAAHHGDGMA